MFNLVWVFNFLINGYVLGLVMMDGECCVNLLNFVKE